MCGSLRLEKLDRQVYIGGKIPSTNLESTRNDCTWNGWARVDGSRDSKKTMVDQWDPKEWKITAVKASSFTERQKSTGKIFTFKSKRLGAIIKDGDLKILTRPARKGEVEIHSRMPVKIPNNMSLKDFTEFVNRKLGSNYDWTK